VTETTSNSLIDYGFEEQTARYVKVIVTGCAVESYKDWNHITEMRVYSPNGEPVDLAIE